jgi:hypothetical protein
MSILPSEAPYPRRLDYNAVDGVIDLDLSGLRATAQDVDAIADAIIAMASGLPKPPYVVACWYGTILDADAARRYAERLTDVARHVRAIVRYQAVDSMIRVLIRTETIKRRLQNSRAFIFDSRQDALRAIRAGTIEEQLRQRGER